MAKLTPVNWLLAMIAMLAGAEAATGERLCVQTIVNARKFDASPSKFAGGTGVVCLAWGGGDFDKAGVLPPESVSAGAPQKRMKR